MLKLALLTSNALAGDGIEQMTGETGVSRVVFRAGPLTTSVPGILRGLQTHEPELILLDVGDWDSTAILARKIQECDLPGIVIGFRPSWNRLEQAEFAGAGINYLLREPFSPAEMEATAYEALHKERPIANRNILAFLPAKAGGGCSTVAVHSAAALASLGKSVLLIEADRRSGVLSIMLNLQNAQGLASALELGSDMTPVEWHQHYARVFGVHILPAHPQRRGPLPSWANYYKLLRFVEKKYEYIIADLPEVVNEASAEIVRSARSVFMVCTPEIPSLRMASYRADELETCEIPRDNIHVIVNRWERGRLPVKELEEVLKRPVFATVPNDYASLKAALTESRLASPDSAFMQGCQTLARKLDGLPEAPHGSKFGLLRKLSRLAG